MILSLVLSAVGVYGVEAPQQLTRTTVDIPTENGQKLVLRGWLPSITSSGARDQKVVFLFAGYSATQVMMYPLMRVLTGLGYYVITADFRGHGESGGLYRPQVEQRLEDFDLIVSQAQLVFPGTWEWNNVTIVGHSMGGEAVTVIGAQSSTVFTTVAVAPANIGQHINATHPGNFLVVSGDNDQFFTPTSLLTQFQNAQPNAQIDTLYGSPLTQNARKITFVPGARHESELIDAGVLSEIATFIDFCYGFRGAEDKVAVNQTLASGLIYGGVGTAVLCIVLLGLALAPRRSDKNEKLIPEVPIEQLDAVVAKSWIKWYLPGTLLGVVAFGLFVVITPAGFSSTQYLLMGISGFTALLSLVSVQHNRNPKAIGQGKAWLRAELRQFTGSELGRGIALFVVTVFLLNFGLGQYYLSLFPWNLRAVYAIAMVPFFFFMYLFQQRWFSEFYIEKARSWKKGLGVIILLKFGLPLGLGLILLGMGNFTIVFLLLFYLIDLVGTILLIGVTAQKRSSHFIVVWFALSNAFVYLGYAVFMSFTGFGPGA